MNNWIQKTLIQEKVNFYFHTDNPFMHMLKMLHLQFYYCTDNGTRFSEVVIFFKWFQWMSWCFCYWFRNEWQQRQVPSIYLFSSPWRWQFPPFNKKLLPDHEKYPLWINIESFEKGTVTSWESFVLKSCGILNFNSDYYIPAIYIYFFI